MDEIFLVRFNDDEAAFLVQAETAEIAKQRFLRNRDRAGFMDDMVETAEHEGMSAAEMTDVKKLAIPADGGARDSSLTADRGQPGVTVGGGDDHGSRREFGRAVADCQRNDR